MPGEKILIVEDEPITAEAINVLLKQLKYEPIGIASTGEDAIAKARSLKPDLVLMDIVLEGKMTGIEAAENIHENLDIPVIFLTAYSDIDTLNSAKKTEPQGYIVKPITDEVTLRPPIELAIYNHRIKQNILKDAKKYHQLKDIVLSEKSSSAELIPNQNEKEIESFDPIKVKEKLLIYLEALSQEERFRIFDTLRTKSLRIFEIQTLIDKTQSTASHHMKILESSGLIAGWKKDRLTQFSIQPKNMNNFNKSFIWWLETFPFVINSNQEYELRDEEKKFLANCFEALGSEERFYIMDILKEKPVSVSLFEQILKKPQSSIYHHIKQLEEAGLITSIIAGKFTEYFPVEKNIQKLAFLWQLWINGITNWFGKA